MKFGLHNSSIFLAYVIALTNTSPVFGSFTNFTDLEALLSFKAFIQADPFNVLNSWNTSIHFCHWQGIRCGRQHQRVTVVNLPSLELSGSLSPYLGNLTFLRSLVVANNSFHGVIPEEIGQLFRLQILQLNNNSFHGSLPSNLTHLINLRVLDASRNNISGPIPLGISSMYNLSVLRLLDNRLGGMIPPSMGNLSNLQTLSLSGNNLQGSIPGELGSLSNLLTLDLSSNNLLGTVPPVLYNLSSVENFLLAYNILQGTFPPNLGFTLPKLRIIYVRGNQFMGNIPQSLGNASQLVRLDIGENALTGVIPSTLENLPNLQVLNLDLNVLGGELPNSIANLSTNLIFLTLAENTISGRIPEGIGNLVNLQRLALNENNFTDRIPWSIGNLTMLQGIYLSNNKFYGNIPSSIGDITLLSVLSMEENLLQGSIPAALSNCEHLQGLDLSHNQLTDAIPKSIFTLYSLSLGLDLSWNQLSGTIPDEIGSLGNLGRLDISNNHLFGGLPPSLGALDTLEFLYIQGNHFMGKIPTSFDQLRGIQVLDLSRNNFSGQIPQFLASFRFIEYLNLSYNRFEGEVPISGVFRNSTAFSILENKNLCGGLKSLMLPSCPRTDSPKKRKFPLIVLFVVDGVLFMVFASVCALCLRKKVLKAFKSLFLKISEAFMSETSNTMVYPESPLGQHYPRLTYADLLQATKGFSEENMIGMGAYSSVYKGILMSSEQTVAVKVLNLQVRGAKKSFLAECQAMRNIRHRNLVKTITACSGIDFQGRDFKALVFEFMSNGSLESWIHPNPTLEKQDLKYLSLAQRLDIAVDVASALHYLHNCCETPIIHRDIKPSNILLDGEFHAHVGDFGLARILLASTERSKRMRSTEIPGTVGYIALEYGLGGPVSTLVDVYSYGILLLEMFTGKRPTDGVFKDDFSLRNYVNMFLPDQVMTIADPLLISEAQGMLVRSSANGHSARAISRRIEQCLASIFRVGVICSSQSPKERMDAADVLMELTAIRNNFL